MTRRHYTGLLLVVGAVGITFVLLSQLWSSKKQYVIQVGQETLQVRGDFETVSDVLTAAGLLLRPEDTVLPQRTAPADPAYIVQVIQAQEIELILEGVKRSVWTAQEEIGPFLGENGLAVHPSSRLTADLTALSFSEFETAPLPHTLEIENTTQVTIEDGAQSQVLQTDAQTVGGALRQAGIEIFAADGVEPDLGDWLTPGLTIRITRSIPLSIEVDDRVLSVRSHFTSTLAVLDETGIGLAGNDYASPDNSVELSAGDTIVVHRITGEMLATDESVPYDTLWQGTDDLELDQRALLSQGSQGLVRRQTRVLVENGVEVTRQPGGEWLLARPVNEVIGYGTRVEIRSVDTPTGPLDYWRKVRMWATSYTAASSGKPPDHPAYGITASGVPAGQGVVAVDPRIIPFRSQIFVPGYGVAFAGDTGGGVKGLIIDLGYNDGELVSWNKYVDVYFLTPIPASDQIDYLIP